MKKFLGFSILELIVGIFIVSLLVVSLTPISSSVINFIKRKETEKEVRKISEGIIKFYNDNLTFPSSLTYLLINPGISTWKGPYVSLKLDELSSDPFKFPWGYTFSSFSAVVISRGKNGIFDSFQGGTTFTDADWWIRVDDIGEKISLKSSLQENQEEIREKLKRVADVIKSYTIKNCQEGISTTLFTCGGTPAGSPSPPYPSKISDIGVGTSYLNVFGETITCGCSSPPYYCQWTAGGTLILYGGGMTEVVYVPCSPYVGSCPPGRCYPGQGFAFKLYNSSAADRNYTLERYDPYSGSWIKIGSGKLSGSGQAYFCYSCNGVKISCGDVLKVSGESYGVFCVYKNMCCDISKTVCGGC